MIEQIDIMIMEWINQLHNPLTDAVMVFFSYIGDLGIIWIVISLLLMVYRQKKAAIGVIIALLISYMLTDLVLKNIFNRPRPFVENKHLVSLVHEPISSSFPSGHTSSSFATASFLYKRNIKKWFMLSLAILISFSRIYVNVHHPSDVIAGVVLGVVIGVMVNKLINYISSKYIDQKDEE